MLYVFLSPVQLWPHSNQTQAFGIFSFITKKWHLQPPRLRFSGVKRIKKEKSNPLLVRVNHLRTRLLSVNRNIFTCSYHHWCDNAIWISLQLVKFSRTSVSGLEASSVWAQLENCRKCPQPRYQLHTYLNRLSFIYIFQVFLVLRSTLIILHQPPPSYNRW